MVEDRSATGRRAGSRAGRACSRPVQAARSLVSARAGSPEDCACSAATPPAPLACAAAFGYELAGVREGQLEQSLIVRQMPVARIAGEELDGRREQRIEHHLAGDGCGFTDPQPPVRCDPEWGGQALSVLRKARELLHTRRGRDVRRHHAPLGGERRVRRRCGSRTPCMRSSVNRVPRRYSQPPSGHAAINTPCAPLRSAYSTNAAAVARRTTG